MRKSPLPLCLQSSFHAIVSFNPSQKSVERPGLLLPLISERTSGQGELGLRSWLATGLYCHGRTASQLQCYYLSDLFTALYRLVNLSQPVMSVLPGCLCVWPIGGMNYGMNR